MTWACFADDVGVCSRSKSREPGKKKSQGKLDFSYLEIEVDVSDAQVRDIPLLYSPASNPHCFSAFGQTKPWVINFMLTQSCTLKDDCDQRLISPPSIDSQIVARVGVQGLRWTSVLAVLQNNELKLFKKKGDEKPKISLTLDGMIVDDSNKRPFSLFVVKSLFASSSSDIILNFKNEAKAAQWKDRLQVSWTLGYLVGTLNLN